MRVYAGGPINGCKDTEANSWRDELRGMAVQLHAHDDGAPLELFTVVDPMVRDYRGRENDPGVDAEIVDGDITDIDSCDSAIFNCWQASWGTAMEVLLAHQLGTYTVCVLPEGGRISPWLSYHADAIVHTLPDAVALVVEFGEAL